MVGNQLTHKTFCRREGHYKPREGGGADPQEATQAWGWGGLALGRQIPTFGFENHRGLISQVFITSGAQHRYFKNSADSALGEPESNRKMSACP